MVDPIIRLERDLNLALSSKESVITKHFNFNGVQLLPFNTDTYYQQTNTSNGIELEDYTVYVVDLKSSIKTDITSSFIVFENNTDSIGKPQCLWGLTNIPVDFGFNYVYLEINQVLGETFYSSPFKITEYKKEFTARLDYRDSKNDFYQSIQLETWFRQTVNRDELATYYELSTKNTVTQTFKASTLEKWYTGLFSNNLMVYFRDIINSKYLYIDKLRANIVEPFEIPTLDNNQNFSQKDYLLSVNKNDVLNENDNDMSLLEDVELIKKILAPLTGGGAIWIWQRPAIEIPEGWAEVTIMEGKTIVGRKDGDSDFGLLLQTGGNKTSTLVSQNIPKHRFKITLPSNIGGVSGSGGITYNGANNNAVDLYTEYYGGEIDGSTRAINTLDPYAVVEFIEWVGLP